MSESKEPKGEKVPLAHIEAVKMAAAKESQTKACPLSAKPLGPLGICRRWVARLLAILVAFPLILFFGLVLAIQFVDFNRYKPLLEETFLQQTGYSLDIQGVLKVNVLPFSLEVSGLKIQNLPGYSSPYFAQLKSAQFELSLWDLFIHQKVNILGLELDKPQLNLERQATGENNWSKLARLAWLEPEVLKGFHKVSYQPVRNPQALFKILDWHLNSLVIREAEVHFVDPFQQQGFDFRRLNLMAFDVYPDRPFKLIGEGDLKIQQDPVNWYWNGNSQIQLNQNLTRLAVFDWSGFLKMKLAAEYNVPEIRVETEGQRFELDREKGSFELRQAQFQSLKTELIFDLAGDYLNHPQAEIKGHIVAKHLDIQKWFRHLGKPLPKFVNQLVLTDVNTEFDWQATATQRHIENLKLAWDQSLLQGNIWQQSLEGQAPQYRFDLALDKLNLDAYQAEVKQSQQTQTAVSPEKLPADKQDEAARTLSTTYLPLALPVQLLRENNVAGQLKIGQLQAWQIRFEQLDLSLEAVDGKWLFAPLDARLYQGQLSSKLILDVSGKTPAYQWSGKLDKVVLAPLLQEGWGYASLSGVYDGHFRLDTEGVNGYLLRQNLKGQFLAKISQGAFSGLNLQKLLTGQGSESANALAFDRIVLDGKIEQGVFGIKQFNLYSKSLNGVGEGSVDLVKARIDARIYSRLAKPPKGLEALSGIEVPLEVKGALKQPKWSVNLDKLLQKKALGFLERLQN